MERRSGEYSKGEVAKILSLGGHIICDVYEKNKAMIIELMKI